MFAKYIQLDGLYHAFKRDGKDEKQLTGKWKTIMHKAKQENKQIFASHKGYLAELFIVLNIRLAKQTLITNDKQSH